jgi:hypothetical protein
LTQQSTDEDEGGKSVRFLDLAALVPELDTPLFDGFAAAIIDAKTEIAELWLLFKNARHILGSGHHLIRRKKICARRGGTRGQTRHSFTPRS